MRSCSLNKKRESSDGGAKGQQNGLKIEGSLENQTEREYSYAHRLRTLKCKEVRAKKTGKKPGIETDQREFGWRPRGPGIELK